MSSKAYRKETVSVRDCTTVGGKKKTKSNLGGKVLFHLHLGITICHLGKSQQELRQGRNLEAGNEAQAMEECCLVARFSWFAQPAFL